MVEDGPISPPLEEAIGDYLHRLPLRTIKSEENVGLAKALNLGVQHATQPWILRFDSDDICNSNRIEIQKKIIRDNDFDFFGGQITEFDDRNECSLGIRKVPLVKEDIVIMLYKRNPFNHVTMCIRRDILIRNPYPDIPGFEDYALWATLISKDYQFGNISSILVQVRAGSSMLMRRSGMVYIKREIKLRKHMLSLSFYKSHEIIWFGFIRCLAFTLPLRIKSLLYLKYLRG